MLIWNGFINTSINVIFTQLEYLRHRFGLAFLFCWVGVSIFYQGDSFHGMASGIWPEARRLSKKREIQPAKLMQFSWFFRQTKKFKQLSPQHFDHQWLPVIGYPCLSKELLDRGKLCMSLEGYVQPKELFRGTKRRLGGETTLFSHHFIANGFGQCWYAENGSFCKYVMKYTDELPWSRKV